MLAQKTLDQLVLPGTGRTEHEKIESIRLHAGTELKSPKHTLLSAGQLEIFECFGGFKLQFLEWTTVVDLIDIQGAGTVINYSSGRTLDEWCNDE
ncbi:hypothetical protein ACFQGA_13320 [Marinobacter koreensis]|uniref:hypothetical protein n=1 Tax=Marinobacter koreensis TaxID=335974 RepID=UPI003612DD87